MSQNETGRILNALEDDLPVFVEEPVEWRRAGSDENGVGVLTDAELPAAERVRSLVRHAHTNSVAYQSVAVAGLQILERVIRHEQMAAAAAISLAQRVKLHEMVCSLEQTAQALRSTLSTKGSKMFFACTRPADDGNASERSWWFALTETISALESGIESISGIVSGQPKGGASRVLGGAIAKQLHRHHNELLSEAEHWIG